MKSRSQEKIVELIKLLLNLLQTNNFDYDLKPEIRLALETLMNNEANRGMKIEVC